MRSIGAPEGHVRSGFAHEGLVLGGSSAINIVGAMRALARDLGPGKTIVTILADGGAAPGFICRRQNGNEELRLVRPTI